MSVIPTLPDIGAAARRALFTLLFGEEARNLRAMAVLLAQAEAEKRRLARELAAAEEELADFRAVARGRIG